MEDDLVRRVAVRQLMDMDAAALVQRADALRRAPRVPPAWRDGSAETSLAQQADLAMALAPLRVEFDDLQWAELRERVDLGEDVETAAKLVREKS
ncbi:hypothetical protein ACXR8F_21415 [Terrabacter sp. AAH1]